MANNHSPDHAPVINPADLAAIIAKSHSGGFAATGPHRGATGIVADTKFLPADFESMARQSQPLAPQDTATPPTAPKPKTPAFADITPPPVKPARDFDAELAAAFEKGRAEGMAQGQEIGHTEAMAEAQAGAAQQLGAELVHARDAFLAAATALTGPQDELAARLCTQIEGAILRLASQRAGLATKDNPAAFLQRIERLADRVAQGLRMVTIGLHPDDLAQIHNHLEGRSVDLLEFAASDGLTHGDVTVTARGITLSDLLLIDQGSMA